MGDAAHAELLDTPNNYHDRHLGEDKLPNKMKVWRVQKTEKTYGSVVARSYGFTDSPDAEVLTLGFNGGKEYGAIRLAALINRIKDEKFFSSTFSPELRKKYEGDPNGLVQYYRDDFEFIYRDKGFLIDNELKSLGLDSNRQTETLGRLISLLEDEKHADTARLLLARYTNESFQGAEQWRAWFENNKDRIFFSDVGGYKFFVVPEGYIENKTPTPVQNE